MFLNLNKIEDTISVAIAKSYMSEGTVRRYIRMGKLLGQCKKQRTWRTGKDQFEDGRDKIEEK